MLAFNLGVFFRNLKGEDVSLFARNEYCEVRFSGGVENLEEHTALSSHLAVSLSNGDLICRITFEDAEEEETPESTEVEIVLAQKREDRELVLLKTTFHFEEITLKPASGQEEVEQQGEDPDNGPLTA